MNEDRGTASKVVWVGTDYKITMLQSAPNNEVKEEAILYGDYSGFAADGAEKRYH